MNDTHLAYEVDAILNSVDDYLSAYKAYREDLEGEQRQVALQKWLGFSETWFNALESRMNADYSSEYLVGNQLTIADYAVVAVIHSKVLNSYGQPLPLLKSLYEKHTYL
jgi:glutathione S-transferase